MFTLIIIGLITFLLFVFYRVKYSYWASRGIKGPKAYPFLGTLIDEMSLPAAETEIKYFKKYGKVFGTYMHTKPILNTSNPEHIRAVLTDMQTFPSGGTFDFHDKYLKNSMFFKTGHDWKMTRAAQTQYFTSKRFRTLLVHFEKITSNFIEDLETSIKESKTGDIDIKKLAKFYTIDVIGKVLFALDSNGFKEQNTTYIKNAIRVGEVNKIQAMLVTILPDWLLRVLRLNALNYEPLHRLGDYFKEILRERRKSGIKFNDLTELLQDAVDGNKVKLTETQVIGNMLLAFFAGAEGVSNNISNMAFFLSEYPEVQAKVYDEIQREFSDEINYENLTQNEYLDALVHETLRLSVSFLSLGRTAARDTKIGDIPVEKGTRINVITYISNILPENYPDPFTFNPDRFLKGAVKKDVFFTPFGLGPKQCLGMRLALIEAKYLIVRLLQNYEILKANDNAINKARSRGFNGTDKLNVRFRKRVA